MALITPQAIAAAAAAEIPKIIRDGIEKEIGGRPDFIASGTPESVAGQLGQAAGRSACRQYAAGQSGLTGQAAANAERVCRPYLDGLNPGGQAGIANPFQGGQCAAIRYNVVVQWTGFSGERETVDRSGFGPIAGFSFGPPFNGNRNLFVRFKLADGVTENLAVVNLTRTDISVNPVFLSIARDDGQPDTCGNPPPEVIPPRTDPDPVGKPFRFNPSPFIDLPINVDINPDGTIGVDFGTGPITVDAFNGDGGGGGDGGGDGGGGGGGGAPPGDVGSPGTAVGTGLGGDAEGEAPEGQVLVGLKLEILEFPPSRTLSQGDTFRAACYVYMGVPGLLDLDQAGLNLAQTQFVFAEKENLTNWLVRANNAYSIRATPYYRTPE